MTVPAAPSGLLPPPFADGAEPGQLRLYRSVLERTEGRDLLVLIDGMGAELLAQHRALTPTLRRLEDRIRTVRTVAPSTTSTAMVSLHTGLPPIRHGVLGYRTFDADLRPVHQLTGESGIDPDAWMPEPGLAESTPRRCLQVSPARHAGSFMTRHLYRGWEFRGHGREGRLETTVRALRAAGPNGLVHLHVDDVDHAGHVSGVDSDPWREALGQADALLGALIRRSPKGTRITVTADHGMVQVDPTQMIDLSTVPAIARNLRAIAGEARALVLAAGTQGAEQLAADVREHVGERAWVLTTDEAVAAGIWGPPGERPDERVAPRTGDVLLLARGRETVGASELAPPGDRPLLGVHGSLTSAESLVPVLQIEV